MKDIVDTTWEVLLQKEGVLHLASDLRKAEIIYRRAVFEARSSKKSSQSALNEFYDLFTALYSEQSKPYSADYCVCALNVIEALPGVRVVEITTEIRRGAHRCLSRGNKNDAFHLNRFADSMIAPKRAQLERALKLH